LLIVAMCSGAALAQQAPSEHPTFRIGVDVVSIDAVVTDRNGDVVRDLTAADFEVLQDGKPRAVTMATFVSVTPQGAAGALGGTPAAARAPSSGLAYPPPSREQVRRTLVFVVDDLGLSGQSMGRLLAALRRFVDAELRPGDLAAIVRTGESNGLLQALTNDRGALHATIDALEADVQRAKGPWAFGDVVQLGFSAPGFSGPQRALSGSGSLIALSLVVQAARDLPGRKTVVFASEGLDLRLPSLEQDPHVLDAFGSVIDQAARAGVVIYAIDCVGLETGGLRASDDIHYVPNMTEAVRRFADARLNSIHGAQQSLAYLAEETGGFAVLNTNDLAAGLRRIGADVRDYYVIGYEPDPGTFTPQGTRPLQHTISVKVRRPGLRVKSRKSFVGVSDPQQRTTPPTPAETLVRAAMSPFTHGAIGLHATHLMGYSPDRGTFVRTVLHVDTRALTFSTAADGTRTATVDLVGLVFGSDGVQVHDMSAGFDVTLDSRAAPEALAAGLVYTARLPVPSGGGYQVRFAIRDRRSSALGAVGEFVAVPDVRGGAFALSGLVLRAAERAIADRPLDSDRFSLAPTDALRVYPPGTTLAYTYELYNAGTKVDVTATLWRGRQRLQSAPSETLTRPARNVVFSATGRLTLGRDLPADTYVLELTATSADPGRAKSTSTAVGRVSFDVR
jgi:VWFA-related protein